MIDLRKDDSVECANCDFPDPVGGLMGEDGVCGACYYGPYATLREKDDHKRLQLWLANYVIRMTRDLESESDPG